MVTKKKPTKRPPREDFNEAAFRIVQQATREKPIPREPRKPAK